MIRASSIILGIVLSALVAEVAAAQWNVATFDAGQNRVYTSFGLDPAFVTTVGYGRVVPVLGHRVQFAGDVGIGAAQLDANDFRARLQAHTSIVHWRSLHLTGSATAITRGTKNSVYRGLNFGADIAGTAGVYRPGWFLAGEFGFDKAVISHITHSDWYRKNVYPDAKDGWYLDAGGTYRHGVTAGIAIGRAEFVGRFGWQRTEKFNDLTPPMYATLGTGFRY
jgi:hypothetical protein